MLGDGQPPVDRRLLGDEADPRQLPRAVTRMAAEDGGPYPWWCEQSDGQMPSEWTCPAPFGPTSPTTFPSGIARVQSRERPPPAVALAEPVGLGVEDVGHATPSANRLRKAVR